MTENHPANTLQELVDLPVSEFVLHRKPLLLIDRLIRLDATSAECEWRVRKADKFLMPGLGVPSYIGMEYMAQCISVHDGACEYVLGFPPPLGMILGTRHLKSKVDYFDEGSAYQVACEENVSSFDGMGSFDCSIVFNGQVVAEARLSVLKQLQRNIDG